ncbi:MAG: CRISPR system precrRNA processing endoribonuclease RAMP protein Cas6 [Clostridiales bacterium]|nr:CRISPR system precrRNA processing endoribonuclease RAMP protein Cas6 [Clostridiales bacterium]
MPAKIELLLDDREHFINRNMGSLFHGALMEMLPFEYAERLHENSLKPFSQYTYFTNEGTVWRINCLNDECSERFNKALIIKAISVFIRKKERELKVLSKSFKSETYRDFIENTYFSEVPENIRVIFKTPTAFKVNGRYVIYPDMGLIYKNLINKFDGFSDEYSIYDEETLESLIQNSFISSYNLQSTAAHMEGVRIPSFMGWINIKISKKSKLGALTNLLVNFGEYSGIGIKTALGMGAVEIRKE